MQSSSPASPPPKRASYVGVTWNHARQQWHAAIMTGGIQQRLGHYDSEKDAALKYDEVSLRLLYVPTLAK